MSAVVAIAKPAQAAEQPARTGCGLSDRSTSHAPMLTGTATQQQLSGPGGVIIPKSCGSWGNHDPSGS
jgi:hypothetical protein